MVGVYLEVGPQLGEEGDRGPVLQVAVQVLPEAGLDQRREVCDHPRSNGYLGQHVNLEAETRKTLSFCPIWNFR